MICNLLQFQYLNHGCMHGSARLQAAQIVTSGNDNILHGMGNRHFGANVSQRIILPALHTTSPTVLMDNHKVGTITLRILL